MPVVVLGTIAICQQRGKESLYHTQVGGESRKESYGLIRDPASVRLRDAKIAKHSGSPRSNCRYTGLTRGAFTC